MSLWFAPGSEQNFAGLRPAWRIAVFLLLLVVIPTGLLLALSHLAHGGGRPETQATLLQPLRAASSEWLVFGWVLLITFIMSRLERRPLGDYGLPVGQAFGGRFWQGALWGAVALAVLLLWIAGSGAMSFGGVATHGMPLLGFGAAWALAFLAVGFTEEYLFRGYLLVTLSGSNVGFWGAAAILSILFGALHLHNGGEDAMGALSAGLIGLFLCFTWRRSGSLWFAVGLHSAWDYCESFVFGVPDSGAISAGRVLEPRFHGSRWVTGGSVGPEGSIWVLLIIVLLFMAFMRWGPRPGAAAAKETSIPTLPGEPRPAS